MRRAKRKNGVYSYPHHIGAKFEPEMYRAVSDAARHANVPFSVALRELVRVGLSKAQDTSTASDRVMS